MTEPVDEEVAKRVIAQETSRRRDILDRLRNVSKDVEAIERRVMDDFARTDREMSRRG